MTLVLHTLAIDVISSLLAGLSGASSSPGHQLKSCTTFVKHLACQQLHTRKMNLPVSLAEITFLAALRQGLL